MTEQLHREPLPEGAAELAETMFALHGVRGVRLTFDHGEKSWCTYDVDRGISINIDPEEIASKTTGNVTAGVLQYVASHEVGHALDMLELPERRIARSPADNFFDCLIDDTVIDTNLTRFPQLRGDVLTTYAEMMPGSEELRAGPRTGQLMYGLRIGQVTGEFPDIEPDILAKLTALTSHDINGKTFNIIEALVDGRTTQKNRRIIAKKFIRPLYDELLEQDQADPNQGQQAIEQMIEEFQESIFGEMGDQSDGTDANSPASQQNTPLSKQIQQAVKDARASQSEANETAPEKNTTKDEVAALAGGLRAELELSPADAEAYARSLLSHVLTIRGVSEVFKKLARPTKTQQRLRPERRASLEGSSLHPVTIARVAVQQATGTPEAVWRPVSRVARREQLAFGGLDVSLLIDASASMQEGASAEAAADMALCLIEGLQLARSETQRRSGAEPDVRTQIVLFGSDAHEVAPLRFAPLPRERAATFTTTRAANSRLTLIVPALDKLPQPSGRDNLVIILSDGGFHDSDAALQKVDSLGAKTTIVQFAIGGGGDDISGSMRSIDDPAQLPARLLEQLKAYMRKVGA